MHADLCVPMQHQSFGGSKYLAVMIAAPFRYVRVRLMKSRTEVQEYCLQFVACIDRNFRQTAGRV